MKNRALLFDFDGVIADTEGQYSLFWEDLGLQLLGEHNFGERIKGTTLTNILQTYFCENEDAKQKILEGLDSLERNMNYNLIPGVLEFVKDARKRGYKTAIVTSSNLQKMEFVYKAQAELKACFDFVLTSEDFSASKPDPDCYLKAMERCGSEPDTVLSSKTASTDCSPEGAAAPRSSACSLPCPRRLSGQTAICR